ncbi:MAG TPA: glycerophosphodiester phosphodiesterase family protein [Candidatus Limnocylindria bacterium]|nr:glycerophosphodiester phosphodiesterase family protein [Candidatus Limnocylindria bacterium]
MESASPRRVEVIAHRGSSDEVPEHTLAAFRQAIEEGADTLECDVRLTADGHLVCVHDRRVDRTSDGQGIVSTLELAELEELDFAAWREGSPWQPGGDHEEPLQIDPERRGVLTLHRLLALVADSERPVRVAIETKHPTRYAGLVERRLVETLDAYGWAHPRLGTRAPVRVMSFSWLSLRRMRALAPSLERVFLMERIPVRFRDGSLPEGARVAGPSIELIRQHPRYVDKAQRRGHPVHVWTVDDAEDVALCLDLGVEGIITNRPAAVREQVAAQLGT